MNTAIYSDNYSSLYNYIKDEKNNIKHKTVDNKIILQQDLRSIKTVGIELERIGNVIQNKHFINLSNNNIDNINDIVIDGHLDISNNKLKKIDKLNILGDGMVILNDNPITNWENFKLTDKIKFTHENKQYIKIFREHIKKHNLPQITGFSIKGRNKIYVNLNGYGYKHFSLYRNSIGKFFIKHPNEGWIFFSDIDEKKIENYLK